MEDLNMQILSDFGLKAKKIIKEKNGYICDTPKGFIVIKKTMESCEHIAFSHSCKEYLYGAGFPYSDRYILSVKNKPYALLENTAYVATNLLDARETDFGSNEDLKKILRTVAWMHRLSKGMEQSPQFCHDENAADKFSKSLAELHSIKKRVGVQKRLSDFDVIFLKNYAHYENQLQYALAQLNQCKQWPTVKGELNCLCHNGLREGSLRMEGEEVYITGFSDCLMDTPLADLCALIRRYIKNLPSNPMDIHEILGIYQQINPLSAAENQMLYPFLLYPEKFLKLCSQYYSKKRTWIPSALIDRMEKLLMRKECMEKYIEELK